MAVGVDGVAQSFDKALRSRLALFDRRETILDCRETDLDGTNVGAYLGEVTVHIRAQIGVAADHDGREGDADGGDRSDDAQQLERLHGA